MPLNIDNYLVVNDFDTIIYGNTSMDLSFKKLARDLDTTVLNEEIKIYQ